MQGNGGIGKCKLQKEKRNILGEGSLQFLFQVFGLLWDRPSMRVFAFKREDASGLKGGGETVTGGHRRKSNSTDTHGLSLPREQYLAQGILRFCASRNFGKHHFA